jgi:hypothetical protein
MAYENFRDNTAAFERQNSTPKRDIQRLTGNIVEATRKLKLFDSIKDSRNTTLGKDPEVYSTQTDQDWRVKLSIPASYSDSLLIRPLYDTNGFCFPYTPTVFVSHSAHYNALSPVHSNYPFQAYQNSDAGQISLTGQFTVENAKEGQYWVAVLHYLRSVTKMAYGSTSSNKGSPPPVVKLNGYGDYVFNNVPVVVTNFTVDMPPDVDYIKVPFPGIGSELDNAQKIKREGNAAWVPTVSNIFVQVVPVYSRRSVSKFSLDDFINGNNIGTSGGTGFI